MGKGRGRDPPPPASLSSPLNALAAAELRGSPGLDRHSGEGGAPNAAALEPAPCADTRDEDPRAASVVVDLA